MGASLTGLAALGEVAVRTESTRDPMVSPLSSDDCVSPGTSTPGTMSGTSSATLHGADPQRESLPLRGMWSGDEEAVQILVGHLLFCSAS